MSSNNLNHSSCFSGLLFYAYAYPTFYYKLQFIIISISTKLKIYKLKLQIDDLLPNKVQYFLLTNGSLNHLSNDLITSLNGLNGLSFLSLSNEPQYINMGRIQERTKLTQLLFLFQNQTQFKRCVAGSKSIKPTFTKNLQTH